MCKPSQCKGNLKLRPNWSVKIQNLFANNSAMAFVSTTPVLHAKSRYIVASVAEEQEMHVTVVSTVGFLV